MALMECYECEGKISDKALSCPHCGAPNNKAIEQQEIRQNISDVEKKLKSLVTKEKEIESQKSDAKRLQSTLGLLCIGALLLPLCGMVAIVISIVMLLDGRGGLGNLLVSILFTAIGSTIWMASMS